MIRGRREKRGQEGGGDREGDKRDSMRTKKSEWERRGGRKGVEDTEGEEEKKREGDGGE